jgi:regulator of protease activity HflC (stomatin/prohibitin superfamily)
MKNLSYLLLPIIALVGCTVIDSGEVGVVRHFGAVQSQPLLEGVHYLRPWPFSTVEEVNVQTTSLKVDTIGSSKDLQAANTSVAVQYSIQPGTAPYMLQRFGNKEVFTAVVIEPAVQETVKAVTARFTAEELITKRAQVKAGIEEDLKTFVTKTLEDKGLPGAVKFANMAITDFKFSKEFDAAIEAKVKAEQDALRAENEKKRRITQAEAASSEQKLKADARAYQIEMESKARAEAIERESKALKGSPELIELRLVERWNGSLPTYTGSSIPMMKMID